jgi:hypothetical protein
VIRTQQNSWTQHLPDPPGLLPDNFGMRQVRRLHPELVRHVDHMNDERAADSPVAEDDV